MDQDFWLVSLAVRDTRIPEIKGNIQSPMHSFADWQIVVPVSTVISRLPDGPHPHIESCKSPFQGERSH